MARQSRALGQAATFSISMDDVGLKRVAGALKSSHKGIQKKLTEFTDKVARTYNTVIRGIIDSDNAPPGYNWPPLSEAYAKAKKSKHRYINQRILRNSFALRRETKGREYVASVGIPANKAYSNGMLVWEVVKMLDVGSKEYLGSRASFDIPARPIFGGAWDLTLLEAEKAWPAVMSFVQSELKAGFYNFS
ncbi:MAG: hypothetical protein KKD01_19560 [Proteobacteria bacterium]|nr:hypothetical protein [Pseudomonadota bacterium]